LRAPGAKRTQFSEATPRIWRSQIIPSAPYFSRVTHDSNPRSGFARPGAKRTQLSEAKPRIWRSQIIPSAPHF
jgi:hypothetical protein